MSDPVIGGPEQLGVKRVVVWRHGRTTWNADGRYQGQADPPLDEIGRDQCRRAARVLAADPPDLILASDLLRATATADALADITGTPVKVDPRLREIDVGSWQGLTRTEVAARHPEQHAAWLAGQPLLDRGGESKAQLDARVLAALREIDVGYVLLVTHGGTSRSIIDALLHLPESSRRWLAPLGNGHWTDLRRDQRGWRLFAHNLGAGADIAPPGSAGRVEDSGDADAVDDGGRHGGGANDDTGARA